MACGANRVIGTGDRFKGVCAAGGRDDGLINTVGGIVGELDEQQQLREGVNRLPARVSLVHGSG